jgi:hypothetical protein
MLKRLIKRTAVSGHRRVYGPLLNRVLFADFENRVIDSDELRVKAPDDRTWNLEDDTDWLPNNDFDSISPSSESDTYDRYRSPRYRFKEPFVTELQNITLVGPMAVAFTSEGKIIADTMSFDPYNEVDLNPRLKRAIRAGVANVPVTIAKAMRGHNFSEADSLRVACTLHGGGPNYFHWMLENLLKLRGVERYEAKTGHEVPLIIPPNPPSYLSDSIGLVGFDNHQIIEWDSGPLQVDRLVVPSFPELTPKAVGWLRENVFSAVDLGSDSTGWLYVSRQRANGRSVVNYLELKEFLEEREISVVYCEDLSLREQVELFRTADGIIAPHGAGLTNMVWGDNLHVVEIFTEVVQPPYNILAELMGHKYTSIVGTPVDSQFDKRNTNIKLDIDELDSILSMAEDAV